MFQVNSSLFICIICILVAPPDSKWFKPWFYSSCPLSWCMRVAKQFFDSPGSWLASNLCSSRPKTSGIVWLDVPHHSQDEKAGNPEGPQIRWMEKRWKEGRSLWESSAGQATTPTTQISWGAASLSQRFWVFLLSFFKLFLMCCWHLCSFTCANEASSNIFTDGCFNALHAATGENPVRYKPRLNAGQHIAQHSRTVWHKLPGIKSKSWNLIGRS